MTSGGNTSLAERVGMGLGFAKEQKGQQRHECDEGHVFI